MRSCGQLGCGKKRAVYTGRFEEQLVAWTKLDGECANAENGAGRRVGWLGECRVFGVSSIVSARILVLASVGTLGPRGWDRNFNFTSRIR